MSKPRKPTLAALDYEGSWNTDLHLDVDKVENVFGCGA
jgi:hypothetical protein